MNRDLKIWGVILGIVALGMGITSVTQSYMGSGYRLMQEAGWEREAKVTAEAATLPAPLESESLPLQEETGEADYRTRLAEYPGRLAELDAQIEWMRVSDTDSTVWSVKSAVRTEQGIWERELDTVYSLLVESLDEAEASKLRTSQKKWIEERDSKAMEALGRGSGASMESVEYSASIAQSTRARVYELVEQYR